MGDIDTKSRHLFEVVLKKWVVLIKNVTKSEYLLFEMGGMGGNGINEESVLKSEYFWWKKLSICFPSGIWDDSPPTRSASSSSGILWN